MYLIHNPQSLQNKVIPQNREDSGDFLLYARQESNL